MVQRKYPQHFLLYITAVEVEQEHSKHYTEEAIVHGLKHKVCHDLSNLPQLLRQKWKFDIPLIY